MESVRDNGGDAPSAVLLQRLAGVSVFYFLVACAVALVSGGLRFGLESFTVPDLHVLSLLTPIFCSVFLIARKHDTAGKLYAKWFIVAILFLSLPFIGFYCGINILGVAYVVTLLGLVQALRRLRPNLRTILALLCGAALTAPLLLSYVNLFKPELAELGDLFPDQYYWLALSSIFVKFKSIALSFDGLLPLRTHAAANCFVGVLGWQAGLAPHKINALAHSMFFFPLMFYGLSCAILFITERKSKSIGLFAPLFSPLALYVFFNSFFSTMVQSDSNTLSLAFFFIALPWAVLQDKFSENIWSALLKYVLLAALAIVIGFAKISTGFIFLLVATYAMVRYSKKYVLFSLLCMVGLVLLMRAVGPQQIVERNGFYPYAIFRRVPSEFVLLPMVFLLCMQTIIDIFSSRIVGYLRTQAFRQSELVLLVAVAGHATSLLMPSNDWYYFSSMTMWFLIIYVSGFVIIYSPQLLAKGAFLELKALTGDTAPKASFIDATLNQTGLRLGIAVILTTVTVLYCSTISSSIDKLFVDMHQLYTKVDGLADGNVLRGMKLTPVVLASLKKEHVIFNAAFTATYKERPLKKMMDCMRSVAGRNDTVVFVPTTNTQYWTDYKENYRRCNVPSELVPALTGLPLLKGIPASPLCDRARTSFHALYTESARTDAYSDEQLAQFAKAKGFRQVYIFESFDDCSRNRLLTVE